jgi:hypothetical protein
MIRNDNASACRPHIPLKPVAPPPMRSSSIAYSIAIQTEDQKRQLYPCAVRRCGGILPALEPSRA